MTTRYAIGRFERLGIRGRLMLLVGLSFTLFAVVIGALIPIVADKALVAREEQDGREIAKSFARESKLALLYRSEKNAKEAVTATLSFPGVMYVAVYDESGQAIVTGGVSPDGWLPEDVARNVSDGEALIAHETVNYWHFLSPVYAGDGNTEFSVRPSKQEFLGFVQVVRNKESLKRVRNILFTYTVAVTGVSLAVVFLLLALVLNRLLRPVRRLAATLEHSTAESAIRVAEDGPPEIAKVARALNQLMALLEQRDRNLRDYSQGLEVEVKKRTEQLNEALEMALSANRQKSEFLAAVSHDLHTPLQSIISYTEQVISTLRSVDQQGAIADLNIVLQAADYLTAQINNILDFSKIESGHVEVEQVPVDLRELASEVIKYVTPLAERGRNQLKLEYDCDRTTANSDRQKLLRIMYNLLDNACKFTKRGTITLRITCTGNHVRICVADTGRGIAKADRATIFEAFRQARSDDDHPGGVGLGLAIVSRFCALLDATVSVESDFGKGSTFTVVLPFE